MIRYDQQAELLAGRIIEEMKKMEKQKKTENDECRNPNDEGMPNAQMA